VKTIHLLAEVEIMATNKRCGINKRYCKYLALDPPVIPEQDMGLQCALFRKPIETKARLPECLAAERAAKGEA
jgi:hypothetical protein